MEQQGRVWVASEKKKLRFVVSNMSMFDLQDEDVINNVIKVTKELQPDLLVLQGVVHNNPRRSGDKWGKWKHFSQPHTLVTVTTATAHSPPSQSQYPLSIVDILSRELALKYIMYGSSDFKGNAILSKCPITQCSNFGVPWDECGWGVVRITVQTEFKQNEGEPSLVGTATAKGKEERPKEEIFRTSFFGGHRGRSHSLGGDTDTFIESPYTTIGALMGIYCTYMDGVHGPLTIGQVSKILNLIDTSNPIPHVIIGGFRELKTENTLPNDTDDIVNTYLKKHKYTHLILESSGNNSYTWIWVSEKLSELVKFNLESKIQLMEKTKNNMGLFVLELSKQ